MTDTDALVATPLAQQLGFKRGMRVWFHHMPDDIRAAVEQGDPGYEEQAVASDGLQGACLFVTAHAQLQREVAALVPLMATNGFIWIWAPKDLSVSQSDVTNDTVSEIAAATGLIQISFMAVGDRWSGRRFTPAAQSVLRGV